MLPLEKKANVPEGVEFNAELIAQRLESKWNDYKIVEKMTKSTTTVGGNESLKIHIFLKSGPAGCWLGIPKR